MKKGLIGISNNITQNISKIRIWSESFKRNTDGEIILLISNPSKDEIAMIQDLGITYHVINAGSSYYINNKRLAHTADYIEQSEIDLFMVTDVFDVIFQDDPFSKLDIDCYDFFTSGEGVLVSEEPWNKDVLNKCFPEKSSICDKQEIVCSGVMAGTRDALISVLREMNALCEAAEDGHNIRDQAALIILIAENLIKRVKIFNLNDGWAMHCQSAGPTEFLTAWGLGGNITRRYGGIPEMVDDVVYTHTGLKYDIVHQFNRIPDWHARLIKSYE
jgi:hypothetical protein